MKHKHKNMYNKIKNVLSKITLKKKIVNKKENENDLPLFYFDFCYCNNEECTCINKK